MNSDIGLFTANSKYAITVKNNSKYLLNTRLNVYETLLTKEHFKPGKKTFTQLNSANLQDFFFIEFHRLIHNESDKLINFNVLAFAS